MFQGAVMLVGCLVQLEPALPRRPGGLGEQGIDFRGRIGRKLCAAVSAWSSLSMESQPVITTLIGRFMA